LLMVPFLGLVGGVLIRAGGWALTTLGLLALVAAAAIVVLFIRSRE
jgi:hypothetical protein